MFLDVAMCDRAMAAFGRDHFERRYVAFGHLSKKGLDYAYCR